MDVSYGMSHPAIVNTNYSIHGFYQPPILQHLPSQTSPLRGSATTALAAFSRLLCCEVVPQALAYSEKPMPPEEMSVFSMGETSRMGCF